ncbi:MAG TPA: prolyl oligopeptidase family serine peptidase [Gaiellaceae bacterium]|nr:prolyl oligopeptidase family serine peptidase [Gaiellaceae bacterium]
MRLAVSCLFALLIAPAASGQLVLPQPTGTTQAIFIRYRAHDGVLRPALLLLPADYHGQRIPLVISPHGRGADEAENARFWGSLPGRGDFAVINPGGEGRRLHWFSWGAPGEIADLARMPAIAEANGVNVDRSRIYAIGGSMGGQEVLLLLATHPHLLAGAAAFDPDTDMARRYYDFASLRDGGQLQRLARVEIGGTPSQVPEAYARRSPDRYARAIADSHVPLQLYWSTRDRVIRDQRLEAGALADQVYRDRPDEKVWEFTGEWAHTAEMRSTRRLPRALARFGLLPWRDVPPLGRRAVRPAPVQPA